MNKPLPPDPGEFAGCRMKISAPDLDHVHLITAVTGHRITERLGIVACWAHTAWTVLADDLPKYNSPDTWMECQKNAAAWLAMAKGEQP